MMRALIQVWRLIRTLRRQNLLSARSLYYLAVGVWRHGFNMLALLYQAARLYPSQTALCVGNLPAEEDEDTDWQTLYHDCLRCVTVLSAYPAWQSRQKIALLCRNRKMSVIALCALSAGGMPVLLLSTEMSAAQLTARLREDKAAFLLTDDDLQENIPTSDLTRLTLEALKDAMNAVQTPDNPRCRNAGPIRLLTGSGRITERNINPLGALKSVSALLEILPLHRHRCFYLAPPFYCGYGLAVLYLALCLHKQILLTPHFHAPSAARLIRCRQADMTVVMPGMLSPLLHAMPDKAGLVAVLTGGAPLSLQLTMRTRRQWGELLYNLYGTIESGFALLATPDMLAQKPNAVGRPLPGVNIQLRRTSGEPCATNEIGELWLDTARTADNGGRALFSGDLAYQDTDGDIFLKGRADDIAVCGGENVYPQDVCAVVLRYPGIGRAAVVTVADETFGQRVVVFAQPRDGKPDLHDMRLWLSKYLTRRQMPARIVLMHCLPISESGRINKAELSARLTKMTEKDGWAPGEK